MSESKHTQGPWRYVMNPHGPGRIENEYGFIVAKFDGEPSHEDSELIAAAPELLDLLREVRTIVPEQYETRDRIDALLYRIAGA